MKRNREALRKLKDSHALTAQGIADRLMVGRNTVEQWLCQSPGSNDISDKNLLLLRYLLLEKELP